MLCIRVPGPPLPPFLQLCGLHLLPVASRLPLQPGQAATYHEQRPKARRFNATSIIVWQGTIYGCPQLQICKRKIVQYGIRKCAFCMQLPPVYRLAVQEHHLTQLLPQSPLVCPHGKRLHTHPSSEPLLGLVLPQHDNVTSQELGLL